MEQEKDHQRTEITSQPLYIFKTDGILEIGESGGGFPVAKFTGLSVEELVRAVGTALSREQRYNNQLGTPFSVLRHSIVLAEYFTINGEYELGDYAAVHDTAEAFIRDIPAPIKGPDMKTLEASIFAAMPWRQFDLDAEQMERFKQVDRYAAAVEAFELGPWRHESITSRLPDIEMRNTLELLIMQRASDPSDQELIDHWVKGVLDNCIDPEKLPHGWEMKSAK